MDDNSINILVLAKDMASSVLKGVTKSVSDLASGFKDKLVEGIQQANTALLGLAAAAGGILIKSVLAASDAQETYSKFATVFKDATLRANAALGRLTKSYGLSGVAAAKLLSNTGDLLTGFGFTGKKAIELSSQVSTLAVDLASFTNAQGGAEAVSSALTKAMLGEREALKTYGIAIQQADIDAELLKKGMSKLTGEALRQATAQVTLELAVRQSKNAVGDFARTSDSFANRMRIAQASVENFLVELGGLEADGTLKPGGLLDVATQLLVKFTDAFNENILYVSDFVNDNLASLVDGLGKVVEVGRQVIKWLVDMGKKLGITQDIVDKFFTIIKFLVPAVLGLGAAVGILLNPLVILGATLVGIAAVGAILWQNLDRIKNAFLGLQIVQDFTKSITDLYNKITEFINSDVGKLFLGVIWQSLTTILQTVTTDIEYLVGSVEQLWQVLKPVVDILAGILLPILGGALLIALGLVANGFKMVSEVVKFFLEIVKLVVAQGSNAFQQLVLTVNTLWLSLVDIFTTGGKNLSKIWQAFGEGLKKIFQGTWDVILQTGKNVLNGFIDLINNAISSLNKLIEGANKIPGVKIDFIGQIPRFAQGGIVGGSRRSGDNMLIRANSGEEVVTQDDRQTIKEFIANLANGNTGGPKMVNNFYGYDAEQISTQINRQINFGY